MINYGRCNCRRKPPPERSNCRFPEFHIAHLFRRERTPTPWSVRYSRVVRAATPARWPTPDCCQPKIHDSCQYRHYPGRLSRASVYRQSIVSARQRNRHVPTSRRAQPVKPGLKEKRCPRHHKPPRYNHNRRRIAPAVSFPTRLRRFGQLQHHYGIS